MKIIHSFWTKPLVSGTNSDPFSKTNGGWPHAKYNYYSWALSCLKFRQFYDDVELYTDDLGKHILVDTLQLPYTKVHTSLNVLADYNHKLWSLGKIYTYGIQTEPFIHADSDVYIWKRPDEAFETSPLLVQSPEEGVEFYGRVMKEVTTHFKYIPPELSSFCENHPDLTCINSGLIGGTDVSFYALFKDKAFEFIEKNKDCLDNINLPLFCVALDQLYFYCLATHYNREVTSLFQDVCKENYYKIMRFNIVPLYDKYVHLLGFGKKNILACEQLESRLRYEFPEYFTFLKGRLSELLNEDMDVFPIEAFRPAETPEILEKIEKDRTAHSVDRLREEAFIKRLSEVKEHMEINLNSVQREQELSKAYDLIYNQSPVDFLQVRFVLSDSVYVPEEFEPVLHNGEALHPTPHLLYYSFQYQVMRVESLTDWNELLTCFETPLSGQELINGLLQNENMRSAWTYNELVFAVIDFITVKWMYERILMPAS